MFYILARKAIWDTYGNSARMRVTHRFEIDLSPECTKRLIISIIRTGTEAYESNQLLADLRRQNSMV